MHLCYQDTALPLGAHALLKSYSQRYWLPSTLITCSCHFQHEFFLPCDPLCYLIKLYSWNCDSEWICAEVEHRIEINMYDLLNQWFSTFLKLSGTWENWLCSVPRWGQLWTHEELSPCSFVKYLCTCWLYGNYSKSAYNVMGYVIQFCVSPWNQSVRDYMFIRISYGRIHVLFGIV